MRYGEYTSTLDQISTRHGSQTTETVWVLNEDKNEFTEYFKGAKIDTYPYNEDLKLYVLKGLRDYKATFETRIVPNKKNKEGFRVYVREIHEIDPKFIDFDNEDEDDNDKSVVQEQEYYLLPETFKFFGINLVTKAARSINRHDLANNVLGKMCGREIQRLFHPIVTIQ